MTIHTQAEKIGVVAETVQIQHAYFGNHEKQFLPPPAQVKKRREFYPGNFFSPTHYIPRHELLDSLRQTLLTPSNEAMALTSALHGMGGIGKSVMARALCDDSAVKAHFTAGTLVAVLGEKPSEADLIRNLREWVQFAGGTITENAPSLDYLSNLLRESLHDQAYLLVLDDVWQAAHARPFLQGGSQCRVLLTTRDREVARQLAPTTAATPIPTMRPAEAVALLESHADPPLPFSLEDKLRVVKRLGYLPLAIRLAGAQLGFYDDVAAWLAEFKAVKLEAMSVVEVHDSLRQTFELSLRHLEKPMRQRYQTLAIFKEDEATPVAALRHLWPDLKTPHLKQTLHLFTQRALVQSQGEGAAQTMSLHDLLRDFMADELGEAGKIQAHQTLLTSYRATRRAAGWHTAPDDGYLHRHLTYHLNAVVDHDSLADQELHGLFANDAWLHARLQSDDGQYDGYIDDLMTAWQWVQIPEPDLIALNVRYALIRTSINSVAESYSPELVAQAVETGLWSVRRALSLTKKISDHEAKAKMLTLLLATNKLPAYQHSYIQFLALNNALEITDYEQRRAQVLASLALQLNAEEKQVALTQALQDILVIGAEEYRADVLIILAPQLTSKQLTQAFQVFLIIEHEGERAEALIALAPHLVGEQLAQAFEIFLVMKHERYRAKALTALIPKLEGEVKQIALQTAFEIVLTQVFQTTLGIEYEWWYYAEALSGLAPHLTSEQITQIFNTTLAVENEEHRAKIFAILVPHLTSEQLAQTFALALIMNYAGHRAETLIALTTQLENEAKQIALTEALRATLAISYEKYRIRALTALASQLTDNQLDQTLQVILAIKDEKDYVQALTVFAPQLDGKRLIQILQATIAIKDEEYRVRTLIALAPQLEGNTKSMVLTQALQATLVIEQEDYRVETLIALIPYLMGEQLTQILETILTIRYEGDRTKVLITLAPYLKGKQLIHALEMALVMKSVQALTALALQLEDEAKQRILTQTLEIALAIEYHENRVKALTTLLPQLKDEQLTETLHALSTIKDEWSYTKILPALAPQLTSEQLAQALQVALAIKNEGYHSEALIALAPYLEGEQLIQVFQAALAMKGEYTCSETLIALAPYLESEQLTLALQVILGIKSEGYNIMALITFALRLQGELLTQAFQAALAMEHKFACVITLSVLAPRLKDEQLVQAFQVALTIENEKDRAKVLAALGSRLVDAELTQLQAKLRSTVIMGLVNQQHKSRQEVLYFLSTKDLFSPAALGVPTAGMVEAIVGHIHEICTQWRWG